MMNMRQIQETAEKLRKRQQEKVLKDMSSLLRQFDDFHLKMIAEMVQTEIESR